MYHSWFFIFETSNTPQHPLSCAKDELMAVALRERHLMERHTPNVNTEHAKPAAKADTEVINVCALCAEPLTDYSWPSAVACLVGKQHHCCSPTDLYGSNLGDVCSENTQQHTTLTLSCRAVRNVPWRLALSARNTLHSTHASDNNCSTLLCSHTLTHLFGCGSYQYSANSLIALPHSTYICARVRTRTETRMIQSILQSCSALIDCR